jgi:DNA-binding MarR family transcriptional regulator
VHHRHGNDRGTPGGHAPASTGIAASPEERQRLREHVRQIRNSRDLRRMSFDQSIFGEPAWEILLALYTIDCDRRRLNTRELSKLANLALTTALRWLDHLEEQGLIGRRPNPFDQRMVYVELSEKGRAAMDDYLSRMQRQEMFGPIAKAGA